MIYFMTTTLASSGRFSLKALLWLFTISRPAFRAHILFIGCLGCFLGWLPAPAQQQGPLYQIKVITPAPPAKSIRGLSVVTDNIVWASGTGGQVGRSIDGGAHWQWTQVPGCDSCDWRSLYAFNDRKAIVLNAGAPALIFLTEDGGQSWRRVFSDHRPGIFFDAMQFFDDKEGIAIGDPIDHKFIVIRTHNGGLSWEADPVDILPVAKEGEAIFAASGTSIVNLPGKKVYFATGGTVARLFKETGNWQAYTIPTVQGSSTTGIFSIAFRNARDGVAVGGDYKQDTASKGNCLLTNDGGQTWTTPQTPPVGYKSCVAFQSPRFLIATGTSGTAISTDGGQNWQEIGKGFNVAARARKGSKIYLAGKEIAQLDIVKQ